MFRDQVSKVTIVQSNQIVADGLRTAPVSVGDTQWSRNRHGTARSEIELVTAIVRSLKADWPIRAIGTEIRAHGRHKTDVVALLADGDIEVVCGIEAKLTDWRSALAQAFLNTFAYDLSYVALPADRVRLVTESEARNLGIGIMAVTTRGIDVALPAARCKPDMYVKARAATALTQVHQRRPRSTPLALIDQED